MFEYVTPSSAFAQTSLEAACAHVAAVGVKKLDLWSVQGICGHLPPNEARVDMKRVRRALNDAGLALHALSTYFATPEVTLARLEQLAELGGKMLVCNSMTAHGDTPADVIRRCEPFVKRAESLGVTYAVENHDGSAFDSLDQIHEVLAAFPSESFGVALAPVHCWKRRADTADFIRSLSGRIALYYAWDWGMKAEKDFHDASEQLPGTGILDFPSMFSALREIEFSAPLCLFAHGLETWKPADAIAAMKRSLAWCRQIEKTLTAAPTSSHTRP